MEIIQSHVKNLLILIGALFLLIISVLIGSVYFDQIWQPHSKEEIVEWDPKTAVLNNPTASSEVKKGFLILDSTSHFIGPLSSNFKYAGNNLSCTSCHLNGGTLSGAASWIGIFKRFPQFSGRENKSGTLVERINGCMERSMNGIALPKESDQMRYILAYMKWLDYGLPKLNSKDFKGYPKIELPSVAVNLKKGKSIYINECLVCHGENGQGIMYQNVKKGYQYPPLWGPDSYNDGAGMNRVLTAAAFIKNNMPYLQATWESPKLSDEEAFHVAGYINSFPRPQKINKKNDYPDKKLKPMSTPYGPWKDNFSQKQHKYGPYIPIYNFYKEKYGIQKTK